MSKNERAKTKSVGDTVRAESFARTTKNILPKKISPTGARNLAIAVIKSGIVGEKNGTTGKSEPDIMFFKSSIFDFWASLAYGCKPDYIDGVDIPDLIRADVKSKGRPRTNTPNRKRRPKIKKPSTR